LTNDENGTEEYEDFARPTVDALIGSVNCEEGHISKIVYAVEIQHSLHEQ
jgi:hypothetical protein